MAAHVQSSGSDASLSGGTQSSSIANTESTESLDLPRIVNITHSQHCPRVPRNEPSDPTWQSDEEAILRENPNRFSMFPIEYPTVWELYKKAIASFWTVEEVDLSQDMRDWVSLTAHERHFISMVLAFFAASDGIVIENLAVRFFQDVQVPEIRAFYGFQIAMENVHSEMYSLLLEHFTKDLKERQRLLGAMHSIPCIQHKAEWALRWIQSGASFAQRLLAFACVEGIHFSASFCAIFWLKKRGLHTDFACHLYSLLTHKLPQSTAHTIVREAVNLEHIFCSEALSVSLVGINADLMQQYVQFVADRAVYRLLVQLSYAKLYGVSNPFDWMEMISLQGKTNFFERRVGEYQAARVMESLKTRNQYIFTTDADF